MRMTPPRHLRLVGLLALAGSPLGAQSPTMVTWTGSMQRQGAPLQEVRYRVPATVGSPEGFRILASGGSAPREGEATEVRFSGISVLFRAKLPSDATCKLDAIPLRGYAGSCVLTGGDTVALTLVPPVGGMLLPDHEVALARDAAPPHLVAGASVFVLGTSGYFEAVRGTNGFTCYIKRNTPGNLWSMCQTREAAEALFPMEQLRVSLRASGIDEARIEDSLAQGFRSGRFRAPAVGAMAYMLSAYAWTDNDGKAVFLGPHLHFYTPNETNARLGIESLEKSVVPMRLEEEGKPDASVIVPVKLRKPA
jgi:hypothetical protein